MISNLNRKPRQLSASFSFNNSTSFIQCPDGSVKRRRHKSSYKDLYLEKLNFVPTQMPAVKGVDYGYSSMYQNNSVNISSGDFKFNSFFPCLSVITKLISSSFLLLLTTSSHLYLFSNDLSIPNPSSIISFFLFFPLSSLHTRPSKLGLVSVTVKYYH